jgi:hypothetical protein
VYLIEDELLQTYYPKAQAMTSDDIKTYLARANSYTFGVIGGMPPTVDDNLKTAVALAFEIMAKGSTAQVDELTGNITLAAPSGYFTRTPNPLAQVDIMLAPYARAFDAAQTELAERSVRFL